MAAVCKDLAGELGLGVFDGGQMTGFVARKSDRTLGEFGAARTRGQEELLEPDAIVAVGVVLPAVLAAGLLPSQRAGSDEGAGQGQVFQLKLPPVIIDVYGAPLGEL